MGHRGLKDDLLCRCRPLLTKANERLGYKGCSNLLGLLEAVNNLIKRVKRVVFEITNFCSYRIRRQQAQLGPTRHGHTPLKRYAPSKSGRFREGGEDL